MTIDYNAGAEACKLALARLTAGDLQDAQWDEHSFFTAAQAYCELSAQHVDTLAKVAELVAKRPVNREAVDETALPHVRLLQKDPLEMSIADAELEASMFEIRLDGLRLQAEAGLRRWTMLCFSRCCEKGDCCHVREAMEVLPFFRQAEKEVKADSENPTVRERFEAHRQRLTDAVLDSMRSSSYFVNLMADRGVELAREFLEILVHTFGWVVDLILEERAKKPRERFS